MSCVQYSHGKIWLKEMKFHAAPAILLLKLNSDNSPRGAQV